MASRHPPIEAVVTEPTPISEEFVSGLHHWRTVGDVTHLIFYVDQVQPPEISISIERRVCRRLVIPNDALARMRRMLDEPGDHRRSPTNGTALGERHNSG